MKTRHWLFLLLAGFLGLPPARAAGQESAAPVTPEMRDRSHKPIPFAVSSPDEAQRFLARRLRRAEDLAGLQKMLSDPDFRKLAEDVARDPRRFGVEDQVKELQRSFQGGRRPDFKDPRWQKLVATVLERQARQPDGPAVSSGQREAWQGLLQRLAEDTESGTLDEPPHAPGSPPGASPGTATPGPQPTPPMTPPRPQAGTEPGPTASPLSRPAPPSAPPPPADLQPRSRMTQELLKFADRLQNADSSLKKSPALHDFIRNLARYREPADHPAAGGESHLPARLRDRLPQLVEALHLDRMRVDPETWQHARSLLPPAPRVSLHPGRLPRVAPPGWPSSVPAPRADSGSGRGQFFLILAVVLGFGALLWRLLAWQNARRPGRAAAGGRLGPWPVPPNAVRTRAELVQAFDHLALLLLGPVARSSNHLLIAARLGEGRRGDRREAAAQLAHLYEQARYAPPDEALADADLAAARHHLCLLAGVHAS